MSFWKNRPLVITIILIIFLIVMIFATSGVNAKGNANSIIGNLVAPVQKWLYDATRSIGDFFGRLFQKTDLDAENVALKEKVAQLQGQLREYDQIVAENKRLKTLMNAKDLVPDYDVVTASVIGSSPGEFLQQFTVNVGAEDGIEVNMVVITNDGLLGKVVSVSDHYCKVMSVIDGQSGVPALVERTRDNGIVGSVMSAEMEEDTLEMSYLPVGANIVPGDTVITSGIGGGYPKGLYIGQVTQVSTDSGSEKRIFLKSAIDFEHIEEVMIIQYQFEKVEN